VTVAESGVSGRSDFVMTKRVEVTVR